MTHTYIDVHMQAQPSSYTEATAKGIRVVYMLVCIVNERLKHVHVSVVKWDATSDIKQSSGSACSGVGKEFHWLYAKKNGLFFN